MMKNQIFYVSIKSLFILLLVSSCGGDKNKIMGRPPGISTSAEENKRQSKEPKRSVKKTVRKKKKVKGKKHFDEDNLSIWDLGSEDKAVWNESQDLDIWATDGPDYNPIFEIEGWPYQEVGSTFRILWKGGQKSVPVYEKPSLDGIAKESISFEKNEGIGWVASHVAVLAPAIYTAKEDILVEGFEVFSAGYLKGDDAFSRVLKKGSKLRLLMYAGDGQCYIGVGNKAIESLCPTPESFLGSFKGRDMRETMQPASRMWWIELEGGLGWIALDNKYIVEIR